MYDTPCVYHLQPVERIAVIADGHDLSAYESDRVDKPSAELNGLQAINSPVTIIIAQHLITIFYTKLYHPHPL